MPGPALTFECPVALCWPPAPWRTLSCHSAVDELLRFLASVSSSVKVCASRTLWVLPMPTPSVTEPRTLGCPVSGLRCEDVHMRLRGQEQVGVSQTPSRSQCCPSAARTLWGSRFPSWVGTVLCSWGHWRFPEGLWWDLAEPFLGDAFLLPCPSDAPQPPGVGSLPRGLLDESQEALLQLRQLPPFVPAL